ncbi:MAG: hypothetical protein WDW38_001991 [Sanguina aurantia]
MADPPKRAAASLDTKDLEDHSSSESCDTAPSRSTESGTAGKAPSDSCEPARSLDSSDTVLSVHGDRSAEQGGKDGGIGGRALMSTARVRAYMAAKLGLQPSLSAAHSSIPFPPLDAPFVKQLAAFSGIGIMIAVGYMDPGNWATDIAGGASYGYSLMTVILASTILATFLQYLALKLGIAADIDLAQACRVAYHPYVNYFLWVVIEIAICATDLAEGLGSAIALNLLFGIPLWAGVLITAVDVFVIMFCELRSFRLLELFIGLLTATITVSFIYELVVAKPHWPDVFAGLVPTADLFSNSDKLYTAIGILGATVIAVKTACSCSKHPGCATVMPHNLYLHSALVQTRHVAPTDAARRDALAFNLFDTVLALNAAFLINAAILVLAAAAFFMRGIEVTELRQAHALLTPILGTTLGATAFAVALLASGQTSTMTGTIAGQIVMEGFLHIRVRPWMRRLVTRGLAIVPAVVVLFYSGEEGALQLLIATQVILSLQLPFAIVPLLMVTSSPSRMGACMQMGVDERW